MKSQNVFKKYFLNSGYNCNSVADAVDLGYTSDTSPVYKDNNYVDVNYAPVYSYVKNYQFAPAEEDSEASYENSYQVAKTVVRDRVPLI